MKDDPDIKHGSVTLKGYVDSLLQERNRRFSDQESSHSRDLSTVREGLELALENAQDKLLLQISALKEILAERDKAVNERAVSIDREFEEFKRHMETRLHNLNNHKAEMQALTATFVPKDTYAQLRDIVIKLEREVTDNSKLLASTQTADNELTGFRLRIDALEARPAGHSAEEWGEMKSNVGQMVADIARLRQDSHNFRDLINEMKAAPSQFQPDEVIEIRRILRAALKADVKELMTDAEVKALRRFLAYQAKREQRWFGSSRELLFVVLGAVMLVLFTAVFAFIRYVIGLPF